MPRSVIVLSSDPDLFDNVRTVLASDSRFIVTRETVHCDGSSAPLTNIYPIEAIAAEWADWNAPVDGVPDPRTSSLLIFESRSSEWIAEVGTLLARGLTAPAWFIDSADTLWPVDRVDVDRVALS